MATTKTSGTAGSADARPSCANEPSASSQASGKAGPSRDVRPTAADRRSTIARLSMISGLPDFGGPSGIAGQSQVSLCSRSAVSCKGETCPQGLMCPLCLDAFKNPTLLACGHTFCKVCLEKYDEQHKGQYFMECPVCRKRTKLAQDRVDAFPSNFSVKVLKEELQTKGNSSSSDNCPLHSKIYKDIFCEDCDKFICLTCFLDKHQGHKIKKKEELDADLKQKRDSLLKKNREKKIQIEKSIASAEQHKLDVHAHFENLKRKVKRTLAKKAKILQENGKQLQKKLDDMQIYHDKLIQTSIADQRRSVDTINKSLKILAGNTGRCTDPDSVKAHHLQFSLLENSLSEITNGVIPAYVKETAKMTHFHPVDENVLDVGHIELGRETPVGKVQEAKTVLDVGHIELGRETPVSKVQEAKTVLDVGHIELGREIPVGKVQEAKTVLDVGHIELGRETPVGKVQEAKNVLEVEKSKNEDLLGANNTVDTPAEVRDSSISIVRKIDLPHNMSGMAALSQNAVVIGYGNDGKGCDCFFVSGGKRPHMKSGIGDVMDDAFLTDRSSVVSHDKNTCCLYNPRDPNNTGICYTFKQGAKFATLCRDQKDNIYAVNANAEIYVFHVSRPDPLRVVSTGNILPQQICVTKTGIMITSTCVATPSTVTVYSEDGLVGSSIKGSTGNGGEHLYAAVDGQDRVLVARVFDDSDVFHLTRHILQGSRLVIQMMFKEIQLPHLINKPGWCYMASLTLNMLAFGHATQLYFLKLAG